MDEVGAIHWRTFEKFLPKVGCRFKREKGDHRVYWKPGIKRPVIIPRDNDLPAFIILNHLRILGISKEKYLQAIARL